MPRLMEKNDWIQTVADVDAAESIWCENVSIDNRYVLLPMPMSSSVRSPCRMTDSLPAVKRASKKSSNCVIFSVHICLYKLRATNHVGHN